MESPSQEVTAMKETLKRGVNIYVVKYLDFDKLITTITLKQNFNMKKQ
jgi:hypothetical protein